MSLIIYLWLVVCLVCFIHQMLRIWLWMGLEVYFKNASVKLNTTEFRCKLFITAMLICMFPLMPLIWVGDRYDNI